MARREREYPDYPFVGVGALIHRGGKVLLVRRKFEPNRGRWTIPGGLVEKGERVEDAARREVREELGIGVELEGVFHVADEIVRDESGEVRFHYVIVDFLATPSEGGGRIRMNGESSEYGWFAPGAVGKLKDTTRNTKAVVGEYAGLKRKATGRQVG